VSITVSTGSLTTSSRRRRRRVQGNKSTLYRENLRLRCELSKHKKVAENYKKMQLMKIDAQNIVNNFLVVQGYLYFMLLTHIQVGFQSQFILDNNIFALRLFWLK